MKPILFLFPIIALVLINFLYGRLLKYTVDKKAMTRFFLTMLLLSFCLNLIWELVQMPFYKGGLYNISHITFCTLASVADAIMTIFFYLLFVFILRDILWIKNIRWSMAWIIVFLGGVFAALSEMKHLAISSWAYKSTMPIIPMVKVGLSPTLQFMVLPLLIYRLSFYLLNKKWGNNKLHLSHF